MWVMIMSKFIVIYDCSGSMVEWGKSDILINTMHTINNYCKQKYSTFDIEFYFWADNIEKFDVDIGIKPFKKKLINKTNLKSLHDFTSNIQENIILLSDGNFELNKKLDFTSHNISCVCVGCDADEKKLSTLSKMSECYQTYSIITVIDDICNGGI